MSDTHGHALGWPGAAVPQLPGTIPFAHAMGWPPPTLDSRETAQLREFENAGVQRGSEEVTPTTSPAVEAPSSDPGIDPSSDPGSRPAVAVPRETAADEPEHVREEPSALQPVVPRETNPWGSTRIITVSNQKGGVGKTTTAVNLAGAMAQSGLRVVVVDMDPQGNASTALSIPHQSGTAGIYDVLIDGLPLAEVLQDCPHLPRLQCAPATIDLAGAEIELVPLVARENRLRKAIQDYLAGQPHDDPVDVVIIDCPPSLGLLTVNSFVAAREVLIPIQCEYYALEGLSQLLKNVELIQQHLNSELRVSTILLTMYDARTRLASDVAEQVRDYFGDRVLRAKIPRSVRVSEAPSHGETVMTYDPTCTGALSYAEAAAEMRRQEV